MVWVANILAHLFCTSVILINCGFCHAEIFTFMLFRSIHLLCFGALYCINKCLPHIEIPIYPCWGSWVVQLVKHLTLGFTSGRDLRVYRTQRGVCLILPLPRPLPFTRSLSFLQWSQLWGPCRALQCYFCHGSWGFQSPWRSSFQILMSQFFDIVSLVNLSCIPLQLPSLLLLSWFLQLLVTQSQNAFVSNSLLHLPPQCLGSYLLAPQVQQFRSCMWDLQSVDSITSPFPPSLTTHGLHLAFYHVKIHS